MKHVLTLLVLVAHQGYVTCQEQPARDLQYYYSEGLKACNENDLNACLGHFQSANYLRPNHQIIMYHLARAHSLLSNLDSSKYYLKKALSIKADLDLSDSAFNNWRNNASFLELQAFQRQLMSKVSSSKEVLRLTDRTLHIESIAHDSVFNRLFLGSVHKRKILEVGLSDTTTVDFITDSQHGMWSVFGMEVDPSRRHLWVCTVATKLMVNADSTIEESSAVYKFNVDSGELITSYTLNDSAKHWFGDLTLSVSGDVYISDSRTNAIYLIDKDSDALDLFYKSTEFISLQGLDMTPDERFLFLADYVNGPYRLDLQSRELLKLSSKLDLISLKSIDGLYFHNNSLVATQNLVTPMRVTQYILNDRMDTIVSYRYLEKGNPLLNEPTLGVVVGDWFYYVANSQWGGYDEQNQLKPRDQLQDIHILKVKL